MGGTRPTRDVPGRGERGDMNDLIVNADLGKTRISRHIYGHFAEHLGRCI